MFNFNRLQSVTATLLALAVTSTAVVPFATASGALAQYPYPQNPNPYPQNPNPYPQNPSPYPQNRNSYPQRERLNLVVPSGTSIPVRYDKDKIVVMPDETMKLTLTVASDVTNNEGRVVIPQGSQITGELEPASGGSRFVAREITIYRRMADNQSTPFAISGTSNAVRRIEEVKKGTNATSILTGAAVGSAAAAAISAITGDRAIATEELLGGAGLGALGGLFLNRKKVDAVVIYPERDLTVRLTSEFARRF